MPDPFESRTWTCGSVLSRLLTLVASNCTNTLPLARSSGSEKVVLVPLSVRRKRDRGLQDAAVGQAVLALIDRRNSKAVQELPRKQDPQ